MKSDGPSIIADGMPVFISAKPNIDMAALRNICAGKNLGGAQGINNRNQVDEDKEEVGGAHEVDLCGFPAHNDIDGEDYICGLEKHGPKVKHGDWIKI